VTRSPDASAIRVDVDGPVARITLDRPERHNALDAADVSGFRRTLDDIDANHAVRVLVLTGAGESTFCSGASLDQMRTGEMSGALFDTLTDRLANLRVPTICRLNGSAYGGGAELALCCDLRIGVTGMRLSVPAAALGVCYPLGGLSRYVQRLGLPAASRILLAAEELDGPQLVGIGFLARLVEPEALDETVDALTDRIASLAPLAVTSMKRILLDIVSHAVEPGEAQRLIDRCAASDDLREGLAARSEGRKPRFRGE